MTTRPDLELARSPRESSEAGELTILFVWPQTRAMGRQSDDHVRGQALVVEAARPALCMACATKALAYSPPAAVADLLDLRVEPQIAGAVLESGNPLKASTFCDRASGRVRRPSLV